MAILIAMTAAPVIVCAAGGCSAQAQTPVREHIVEIKAFQFLPAKIQVNPGDTITWKNLDIAPHTASSSDGSWDTGTINKGESASIVVSSAMASDYICRFHVNMKGSLQTRPA